MKARLNFLVVACALVVSATQARSEVRLDTSPAPEAAETTESAGSGALDVGKTNAADLAKTLANPIGALISVPFQNNFDFGGGPTGHGFQYRLNLQPIIPITLSPEGSPHLAAAVG